jgi:hypothetical protein
MEFNNPGSLFHILGQESHGLGHAIHGIPSSSTVIPWFGTWGSWIPIIQENTFMFGDKNSMVWDMIFIEFHHPDNKSHLGIYIMWMISCFW